MRKGIFAMALVLVLLLSMAACGRNAPPPASSGAEQSGQEKAPATDNKTTTLPSDAPDGSGEPAPPGGTASPGPDGSADAPLGGPDVVGGSTRPIPAQPGTMLVSGLAAVDVLPWSYFTGVMEYDGDQFVVLARELPRGDLEILFSATRNVGDNPHYYVEYVAGSYEQSGKTNLYFTLGAPAGLHWLYRFDLQTERTSLVLDTICSEMVLFDKPQPDIEGLGWVLSEDMILPIRLEDGSVYEAMAHTLEDLGGAGEISYHFWAGIGAAYDTKFPILTALDNGLLGIEVIELDSQTSAPETRIRFQYDCNMVNLWHIETLDGDDGQDCLP